MPSDTHVDLKHAATGLLARARALEPVLAGARAEADELRRVPDETIADFQRGGLLPHAPAVALGRARGRSAARSSTCR